ncbi:uncharacterized protein LOC129771799 [Toxorhynchites rutilus septentrionalis]|uniref:uncharacterized protein LOC129771799 n=1 Tax=Toxorhynchites rutilus septentrionalis TaxID=329112 RepID=UPI002478D90E|nr:uncharacterized protein LOC129771799 [Toxorhynchites rutilus septentrionalis]
MLKGIIKFNGYAVAISCINYAITRVLETNVEGNILQQIPWMKNLLATEQRPESIVYIGFFVASVMLFMGVYWECKVLMVPFVIAYVVVLYDETGGTFLMTKLWEVIYTFYAAISLLLLLMLGICSCCKGDDDKPHGSKHNRKQRKAGCWAFFCCGTCCRSEDEKELDMHSHCSCETLNMRPAGPNDKHYHRVIFV